MAPDSERRRDAPIVGGSRPGIRYDIRPQPSVDPIVQTDLTSHDIDLTRRDTVIRGSAAREWLSRSEPR
ncbi:hypothetical protein SAMN05216207_101468 [Pseudonocardia ammonioxydans]|uniref:Uncharacterized protein n=1 Tax=Pseudonocardia ammonioxydans TaxID=260086 RepID=A0A1I4Z1S4_PSUAM|nr:hypothetical protein SAMN05216207_101468 [Pseudonocardia ammonioxydans]